MIDVGNVDPIALNDRHAREHAKPADDGDDAKSTREPESNNERERKDEQVQLVDQAVGQYGAALSSPRICIPSAEST